jgi:predicted dienelactone hydrolase
MGEVNRNTEGAGGAACKRKRRFIIDTGSWRPDIVLISACSLESSRARMGGKVMRRFLVLAFAALAVVSCASADRPDGDTPQTARARYSGEAGESPVGVIPDSLVRDTARNRDLRVTIEYPTRGGSHPLVIFSTGFNASRASYVGLTSYWASQGYVVMRVSHPEGDASQRQQALTQDWSRQTPADWRNRARDVSFLIDSLPALAERYPELEGKIDAERIGVGGHSYGAFTAMLVGGLRTFPDGQRAPDERVKALVVMSPQGPGETRGLTSESFAELRLPVLFMTGSADLGVTETETPEWRAEAFRLAPAGDKWLAVIEGARHASFTGRVDDLLEAQSRERDVYVPGVDERTGTVAREAVPRSPGIVQGAMLRERNVFFSVRVLSLAFLDAYLRAEASGLEVLERQRGGVTIERR